jgi:antitoxin component YwqK of YwqJK toxin-antitoxin module
MDLINETLLIELYSKYINDSQYVYYKEHDIIIIMKKLTYDTKCLSDIEPKKYHSDNLKVILMFDKTDPYKLVSNITKYKINDIVNSYYYNYIQEAYSLKQVYYGSWQKCYECNLINGKLNGLLQSYYESGQLSEECHMIDEKINGFRQRYYQSGQLWKTCNYIDDKLNGLYQIYYESGQLQLVCNIIDGITTG